MPVFLELLKEEPDNAEVQLAIGICQLELEQFENASQTFTSVNNPLYKDQAQWYMAMTFLKQSDLTSARTILELIEKGDFNYEKAQDLLSSF